jgi:hypothetical protein
MYQEKVSIRYLSTFAVLKAAILLKGSTVFSVEMLI